MFIIFFLIIFLLLLVCSAIAKKQKDAPRKKITAERARIDAILQNIEVYDGSGRGQKRLEDNK